MNKPNIHVNKQVSMIDEAIEVKIDGLAPFAVVELRASRISAGTKKFRLASFAVFRADEQGEIDLNIAKPINGTYEEADCMGLFWSLERKEEVYLSESPKEKLAPHELTLSLYNQNDLLDEITLQRIWTPPFVKREDVRENGLVGTYFYDTTKAQNPGVLVVGGSEGGIHEYLASLLAARGFSVLALGYFGMKGLPERLVNIQMEYIKAGIDWVKTRPEVVDGWIGMHGTSRGAELALLAGSLFDDIKAVVALNGFAVPFAGIVPWTDDETLPPAWTYNGQAIPYLRPENPVEVALKCKEMWQKGNGNPLRLWYESLSSDPKEVEEKAIAVEQINGPILIIGGEKDSIDTVDHSKMALERLKMANFPYEYTQLIYSNAGHSISYPYTFQSYVEGTKEATNFASLDSWEKTISFFKNASLEAKGKGV